MTWNRFKKKWVESCTSKLKLVITYGSFNFLHPNVHTKNCWVVSTQIWVKYGETQMMG